MKRKVVKRSISVKACIVALIVGAGIMYFAATQPMQRELAQYRSAWFWVNFLNQNPDFGRPVGAAWKGENFIVVYGTGYKLSVGPQEVHALRFDDSIAPHSFIIQPAPDVRGHQLERVLNIANH